MGPDGLLTAARREAGQMSWVARRYPPSRLRRQLAVIRHLELPSLPPRNGPRGDIWAVGVVRDEADVIEQSVQHLLRQGVDHVLVADNLSTDGTTQVLRQLSRSDTRVHVAIDGHPIHHQSEKVTWLAHTAWRHGAEWIVPFDADEFIFARGGSVGDFLRGLELDVVHARWHHMVPTHPATRVDGSTEFILDSTPAFPGKVAARSHPLLEVIPGNHGVSRVGRVGRGLFVAHALYRSPEQVARKFRGGMAAALAGHGTMPGTHWVKGARLDDHTVQDVWDRISAGLPEPRIDYAAHGPMVVVRPLSWTTWDPERVIPEE